MQSQSPTDCTHRKKRGTLAASRQQSAAPFEIPFVKTTPNHLKAEQPTGTASSEEKQPNGGTARLMVSEGEGPTMSSESHPTAPHSPPTATATPALRGCGQSRVDYCAHFVPPRAVSGAVSGARSGSCSPSPCPPPSPLDLPALAGTSPSSTDSGSWRREFGMPGARLSQRPRSRSAEHDGVTHGSLGSLIID